MPPSDPAETLAAIARAAWREVDRPTVVLLALAACLPVVYVYQGVPRFYLDHLADPSGPMAPVHAQYWRFGAVFVLFFVLPALAWRTIAGRPLREVGLRPGDWRAGFKIVIPALVVLAPALWISSADPAFQAEYPLARQATSSRGLFVTYELAYALYYWGWEFLFRGALQLGLRPRLGIVGSCTAQLLPSVLLHIGKPIGETWSAVAAAPLFGAVALRTGSFLPLFILHYGIGVLNDVFCAMRQGLL